MTALNPYVERDPNAPGADTVFAGKRYWLVGYCEGDGIWSDDVPGSGLWSENNPSNGIWTENSISAGIWVEQ